MVARDVRSLDESARRALVGVLRGAEQEVARDLNAWYARLGPNAATQRFTAAHLRQVQVLLGVAQGANQDPRDSFPAALARGAHRVMNMSAPGERALATLDEQLARVAKAFPDVPPPQVLHAGRVQDAQSWVTSRHATSADRYAGQVGQDLRYQLGVGLARGETIQQLAKRVAELSTFRTAVEPLVGGPMGAAGAGLARRYGAVADRLVRTEVLNSYNAVALAGIEELAADTPGTVARWDASLDRRLCRRCRALHGTTVHPGAEFLGGVRHPPLHPRCRCAVSAWHPDWAG